MFDKPTAVSNSPAGWMPPSFRAQFLLIASPTVGDQPLFDAADVWEYSADDLFSTGKKEAPSSFFRNLFDCLCA